MAFRVEFRGGQNSSSSVIFVGFSMILQKFVDIMEDVGDIKKRAIFASTGLGDLESKKYAYGKKAHSGNATKLAQGGFRQNGRRNCAI